MRRLVVALASVVPILAVLACGGRTDAIGNGGCPAPASVVQGAACSPAGQSCQSATTSCNGEPEQCVCDNGTFQCTDANVCPGQCPTSVQPGALCDEATLGACSVTITITNCGVSYPATCSCRANGGVGAPTWDCGAEPLPDCPDAQPPGCPAASSIQLGGACAVGSNLTCPSATPIYGCGGQIDGYVSCFCDGGAWNCADPGLPDCPDVAPPPPACPLPSDVQQGTACFSDGQECPGRPTYCGGQVLYDAFQCTAGAWNDVATTICDVDASGGGGGPVDAGAVDAGGG
jgi:hypothetical protein